MKYSLAIFSVVEQALFPASPLCIGVSVLLLLRLLLDIPLIAWKWKRLVRWVRKRHRL
jgi:hypothetical protein